MSYPQFHDLVHRIDGDDGIRYVDDALVAFALANGASKLTREGVLGHSLFDFIGGSEASHITALLLARVRTGVALDVPVRCDSPTTRRFIALSMKPLNPTGIEFRSHIVRAETRDPVDLLDDSIERSDVFVRICSWCKRVFVDGQGWVEIEIAVVSLGLFESAPLPQLTHGICEDCLAVVQGSRT